jgi:hypothetical protein
VTPLTFSIGGVALTKFEVPDKFSFGSEVKLAVHQYIDETGQPIIRTHSQGAFPLPTTWKGTLLYEGAIDRALQLKQICDAQVSVLWIYGPLQWYATIKKFEAVLNWQFDIEYTIELVITQDLNGSSSGASKAVPFDITTQAFFQNSSNDADSLAAADPALSDSLTDAMDDSLDSISSGFPLQNQTIAQLQAILATIDTVINELTQYVTPLYSTALAEADLARMNAAASALNNFGLLQTNLSQLVGTGPYSQTIPNFVGDLTTLASTYYPNSDPTAVAPVIAQANGLTDLFVSQPLDINLPPLFNA